MGTKYVVTYGNYGYAVGGCLYSNSIFEVLWCLYKNKKHFEFVKIHYNNYSLQED